MPPPTFPSTAFQNWLASHQACEDARTWVGKQPVPTAWRKSNAPHWMLWFVAHSTPLRSYILLANTNPSEAFDTWEKLTRVGVTAGLLRRHIKAIPHLDHGTIYWTDVDKAPPYLRPYLSTKRAS